MSSNRYSQLIAEIFARHYRKGLHSFEFDRDEIEIAAHKLSVKLPKNLGDLIYSFRYRISLPDAIRSTAPEGYEWTIRPAGQARYRFQLGKLGRILPQPDLVAVKIPDATPEIVAYNALSDEQALLAKVRYNRLIDIFLGITAYSLQNHLRTPVKGLGQIEIDELYVGLNRHGRQFVVPVQAKGGADRLATIQTEPDIRCCAEKFPSLTCRAVSAQFMDSAAIAMFELVIDDEEVRIVDEKHYRLVPASEIDDTDRKNYSLH